MSSFLDAFDVSQEKLGLIDKALAQAPRQNDRRICICGHAISRHNAETNHCKPARFDCPCKRKHPVLEVPNTRYFMSRTVGSGEKHALTRGIYLAQKAMEDDFSERAKWLVDLKCENPACGKDTKLFPVMCDTDWFRVYDSDGDQGVTAFFCESCREVYFDSEEATALKREALRKRNTDTRN